MKQYGMIDSFNKKKMLNAKRMGGYWGHMSNEIIYTKDKNTAFFHQSEAFSNSLSCTITE